MPRRKPAPKEKRPAAQPPLSPRDLFAAVALHTVLTQGGSLERGAAVEAYRIADALLAARDQPVAAEPEAQ